MFSQATIAPCCRVRLGVTGALLPVLNYALTKFSRQVAQALISAGFEVCGCFLAAPASCKCCLTLPAESDWAQDLEQKSMLHVRKSSCCSVSYAICLCCSCKARLTHVLWNARLRLSGTSLAFAQSSQCRSSWSRQDRLPPSHPSLLAGLHPACAASARAGALARRLGAVEAQVTEAAQHRTRLLCPIRNRQCWGAGCFVSLAEALPQGFTYMWCRVLLSAKFCWCPRSYRGAAATTMQL